MRDVGAKAALAGLARVVAVLAPLILAIAPVPGIAQGRIDITSDVVYATHAGIELRLDVYSPAGGGPFPAVVVIPGGKWVEIDKEKHSDVPVYFAEHGIAAFSIEYRSAREFPYPAAVEDVRAAVRWVREHASEYDVDPSRLGAIGVSAGGHLAALVGAQGRGPLDQGARVNVVASWSGPMDLRPLVSGSADPEIREPVRAFLGCSDGDPCTTVARDASPIVYVDPSDPPMMIVNSDVEVVPLDQAEALTAALDRAGVENELSIALGGHGAGYGGGDKILDRVIPYVQAWIDGRDSPLTSEEADPPAGVKGGGVPVPTATVTPAAGEKRAAPVSASSDLDTNDSLSLVLLTIAALALVLVVVQLFVIAGLRRRLPKPSASGGSGGAEVGEA